MSNNFLGKNGSDKEEAEGKWAKYVATALEARLKEEVRHYFRFLRLVTLGQVVLLLAITSGIIALLN
jgi:hypothetical protein